MRLFQAQTRPKIELSGVSFINLLGKYGNFETDSNADGLADGWINDAGLTAVTNAIGTTKIFGSKAQKITLLADGEGGNYIEVSVAAAQALLVAGYIRAGDTSTTGKLIVDWRDNTNTQISTDTVGTRAVASYARVSAALTAPANTVKARIYATVAGVSGKLAYFDGIQVHNLTAQGALDSIRAAKYSETNWSDLTEAQLEAEIPYFDSVMSVNVADGTASELTVENRGKNAYGIEHLNDSLNAISSGRASIVEKDGYIAVKIPVATSFLNKYLDFQFKPNIRYAISFWAHCNHPSLFGLVFTAVYTDGTTQGINSANCYQQWGKTNFVSASSKSLSGIRLAYATSGTVMHYAEFQIEEGSAATTYVPPRTDSITIPDTVELHGYNGVFNTIDDAGKFTKRLDRVTETSDGSGDIDFSGYDYESGSTAILRNKTTGEVKTLTVSDTIACGWNSVDVEIIYQLETPTTSQLDIDFHDLAYDTLNTLVFTDAKAPIAFSLNSKPLSGYISDTFPFGKKQILQR